MSLPSCLAFQLPSFVSQADTSSHLTDAKLEIISAAVARTRGNLAAIEAVLASRTADAAYKSLVELDLAESVFHALATTISQKAQAYVKKYGDIVLTVGTVLFERQGQVIAQGAIATQLFNAWIPK